MTKNRRNQKQDENVDTTQQDDSPLHTDTNAGPDAQTGGVAEQDVTGKAPQRDAVNQEKSE